MSGHRADQIIDKVAEILRARLTDGTHVYTHRRLSLAADQDELPAISVDFGEMSVDLQDPDEDYYDCTLALQVTAIAVSYDEQDLRQFLLSRSREVQVAVNADPRLALEFVTNTTFTGWDAPEIVVTEEVLVGALTNNWQVPFRMQFDDPAADDSIPDL